MGRRGAPSFTYRLHEVGPQITAGIIAWPAADADAVTDAAPRELTLVMVRRNAPPAPWLPESAHGTPIVMVLACHSGDAADAERDLAPTASANRDWVRNAWTALKPFPTGGNYVNFQTTDEGDERTEESYRSNYARLQQVKAKYDPTNLFRVNRNIRS